MIKKLKRRFILTSMAVVTLVLLLVSAALFIGARRVVYSDADQMLRRSLMFALGEKPVGDGRGRNERTLVLQIDPETGEITNKSDGTLQNLSEEEQQEMAREAAEGKKLKNRGVRAFTEQHNGKTYVAVVDTTLEDRLMTAAVKALGLFAAGVWLALLVLVWLLSGWAVRPMAKAWDTDRAFLGTEAERQQQQAESEDSGLIHGWFLGISSLHRLLFQITHIFFRKATD